ncbi:MAG: GtrA family protein [Clostridia bacterium]|nr:GtrA family protein [Clostridia bacterium]
MFDKIKKLFLKKDFIIFVAIGVVNTVTTTVTSYFVSQYMNPSISFVPGYVVGILVAYLLNSLFTFHEKLSFVKLGKYALATVPNFLIQLVMVFLFCEVLKWHSLIAYGSAAVIGVPVTFVLQKFFTFKK